MQILDVAEIKRYLDLAENVGRTWPAIDAHVHATEVIFHELEYRTVPGENGVRSAAQGPFRPPRLAPLRLTDPSRAASGFDARARNRASRLSFTSAYQHIGRRVLLEHMGLARISVALLLPVAPRDGPVEDQMTTLHGLHGGDERFPLGYSVPNSIPNSEVARDVEAASAAHDVKAVKLHPNLSGIDFQSVQGMERVESILEACGRARLPLIVHGGLSPILDDERASRHSVLQNLQRVDWGRCTEHVVIAHCGVFGFGAEENGAQSIPLLRRILSRHDNVLVDTSGLSFEVLVQMLRSLDQTRIVFGSDALYFSMWQAVVTLLRALETVGSPLEESFAQITSRNARTYLRLGF
jgi:hypothetical protein